MAGLWYIDFLIVFATIFGLEMVDRTNMTVISLSSRRSPTSVWAGAALAFAATTFTAVMIGQVVIVYLLPYILYVRLVGGAGIIAFGTYTFLKSKDEEEEHAKPVANRAVFFQALLLILALETGDDTQILTIVFMASVGNGLLVFGAALAALLSVLTIGVKSGQMLKGRFSTKTLERVSSIIIMIVGTATILYALLVG